MLATLSDPILLLILAALLAQSLVYLIGGGITLRRPTLSEGTQARVERELAACGLLDAKARALPPALRALPETWARLFATGRLGMGAGIVLAAALLLVLLSIPGSEALLGSSIPLLFLLALLLLQTFYLGMVAGQVAGLLLGLSRLARSAPGTPSPRRRSDYCPLDVALLPVGLLLGDVLLIGVIDLLTLPGLPPADVWCLLILPGLLLVVCAAGDYTTRRVARLPALRLSDDPTLAHRADARLRAHLIGIVLELEVFGLFLLVGSQWMLRAFAIPDASNGLVTGALLVYGVIVLSLRGLLARAQRERRV